MKEMKIIFAALLCAFLMTSCHQTGHDYYSHELEKIDHRQNKELARKEVVAIKDEIARQSEDIRMYHLLLLAEMSDEVRPYRNMETARRLVDYYENGGDRQKLLRTYIIAGQIYANCSDSPKALGFFHRAEDMLSDGKNLELRNRLYSKITKLQLHHNMPDAARKYAREVLSYCQQQKDTVGMIEALLDISAASRMQPSYEMSILKKANELARESGRDSLQRKIMLAIARSYVDQGNYHAAKPFALPLADLGDEENALLCRIYYHLAKHDSATYYGEKVMEHGNAVSKRDAHEILGHICILRGQRAEAEEHLKSYIELNDELNRIASNEAIAQADAFYHNQKQEQENEKLRADNAKKHTIIILGVALLVVLMVIFATYIQRHRRRQELMEMRIEHLEQLKRDYAKVDAEKLKQVVLSIESTPIWQRVATMSDNEHPTDEDWQELSEAVNQTYEGFSTKLMRLSHPTPHEYHVCLLLKAGFEPVRIATLTLRSKAAISTVRSRLYEKTFGKKGSAKDWDEVIRTL